MIVSLNIYVYIHWTVYSMTHSSCFKSHIPHVLSLPPKITVQLFIYNTICGHDYEYQVTDTVNVSTCVYCVVVQHHIVQYLK